MRQPDINRCNKAYDLVQRAKKTLESINPDNLDMRTAHLRRECYERIRELKWALADLINAGGGEKHNDLSY